MNSVYLVDMEKCSDSFLTSVSEKVSEDKQFLFSDYSNASQRATALVSWIFKRYVLFPYVREPIFVLNKFGKPYVSNSRNVYFNLSHSGSLLAMVVSEKEVGIDIEFIDRDRDVSSILDYAFSDTEKCEVISKGTDKINYEAFYSIWTLKESYLKAIGKGLAGGIRTANFRCNSLGAYFSDFESEDWKFNTKVSGKYVLSISHQESELSLSSICIVSSKSLSRFLETIC